MTWCMDCCCVAQAVALDLDCQQHIDIGWAKLVSSVHLFFVHFYDAGMDLCCVALAVALDLCRCLSAAC